MEKKRPCLNLLFPHFYKLRKNTSVLVSIVLKVSEILEELDQAEYLFALFCQIGLCQTKQKNNYLYNSILHDGRSLNLLSLTKWIRGGGGEGLVSKETVVLHRWRVETNVWFINRVTNYSSR